MHMQGSPSLIVVLYDTAPLNTHKGAVILPVFHKVDEDLPSVICTYSETRNKSLLELIISLN